MNSKQRRKVSRLPKKAAFKQAVKLKQQEVKTEVETSKQGKQ